MDKKSEKMYRKILDLAVEMAKTTGPASINIRDLAGKAGIATGTIYSYFANKDDLLLAITEEYWQQALIDMKHAVGENAFYIRVEEVYIFLSEGINQSAGILMGSLRNVEATGRRRMQSMQQGLTKTLIQYLEEDELICGDLWTETFTKESYGSFITMNLILLLQMRYSDISFFIQIIKRTLY